MNQEEKPVYMEDGKVVSLYIVAFEREGGKMTTLPKKPDEELWYLHIVKNFVLPRDDDLSTQPAAGAGELSNLGIGPQKKRRAPTTTTAPKKKDAERAESSKGKNAGGEKKGMRRSSDSLYDYVVVSDSLEGLAPVVIRRRKPEPKDSADIPPSNTDDPIDLESSPERLVRKRAGKRKQSDADAEGQPAKKIQRKKITRRGNLDAFISEPVFENPQSAVLTEPLPVNEELLSSPPRASVADQLENTEVPEREAEKAARDENLNSAGVVVEAEKITSLEVVDGAGNSPTPELAAHDLEKGKTT
ncbi:hypothetical protein HanPI659440_Chr14g0545031 [Helianthus annuus]|nr:hypothetical protein HanPI659440_Chr14g0545031 [Helianthus annuus]